MYSSISRPTKGIMREAFPRFVNGKVERDIPDLTGKKETIVSLKKEFAEALKKHKAKNVAQTNPISPMSSH